MILAIQVLFWQNLLIPPFLTVPLIEHVLPFVVSIIGKFERAIINQT
jgi:hypothetical protein